MTTVLRWVVVALGVLPVAATALSFSRSPHWSVRMWDFPRLQLALLAALSGAAYGVFFFDGSALEWLFFAALVACLVYQGRKVFPYTPLARVQVQRSTRPKDDRTCFRLLISNVLMENEQHERLAQVVRDARPDIALLVEVNDRWARALEPLAAEFPHVIRHPQENYYGLLLLSRFPLVGPRVDFLVQDDIPSVHTGFELPDGTVVLLHGLHPRPPEPVRDQDSTPRDAELVVVGRAIGESDEEPTVVAGDLNDVAWSRSSELFLRLSALLDPRVGRGLYNSYNAKNFLFRYPLDHVFHSGHFRLVSLERLPYAGSDHFPMLVELSYEPEAVRRQQPMPERPEDTEVAEEMLETQAEAAQTGDDRPGRE